MSKETILYKLPEDWLWTTLGDLGIVVSGGTPSTKEPQFWGGDIAWITPADLSGFKDKYISKGKRYISELGLEYSSASILPSGSLLFSSRAPIGYVAIAKGKLTTNQGFKNLVPANSTYIDYLYYYLLSAKQLIDSMASGTTFLELSGTNFAKIPIPLAPLKEQYRIVAKIEELFSSLDNNIEILRKEQKQLIIYRHAVLKKEFSLMNKVPLKDFAEIITKGSSPKWQGINYTKDSSHTLFITSENIQENRIDIRNSKYVESSFNEKQKRSILKRGDVLLNIVGASIGRAAIFDIDSLANINQAVALIRLDERLDSKYLSFFLNSSLAREYYKENMVDVARANLSLSDVSNIPIPYCDIEKQNEIVNEIDYKFTNIDYLEKTIQTSIENAYAFRMSILKKAFSGRLVDQDIGDESAKILLQNIMNEKKELLAEQKTIAGIKPKKMNVKKTLLENIKDHFEGKDFTYDELRSNVLMSYEDIKDQLFNLIKHDDKLAARFDTTKKKIVYKLKS